MIELKTLIEKYISQGVAIDSIKKEFLIIINEHKKAKTNTKRKRKREICRPVMFISDSSCDEEN
tara:strand:+ start:435 stop:626 length:192 start_codon:yes stop_codon:yes gene_type:complete